MPKMLETYNPFGGGINSKDDARDIAKNELVDCVNIMVDSIGKVRTSTNSEEFETAWTIDYESAAEGLFVWNSDASWNNSNASAVTTSPTEFICAYNSGEAEVDLYPGTTYANPYVIKGYNGGGTLVTLDMGTNTSFTDATCDYNNDPTITMDDTSSLEVGMNVSGTGIPSGAYVESITSQTEFELSSATTGGSVTNGTLTFLVKSGKATFYAADNALRVLNANFLRNTGLTGKWFGFIDRAYFPTGKDANGNIIYLIAASPKWYVDNNNLPYPSRGFWSHHISGTSDAGASTTAQIGLGATTDDNPALSSGAYSELNTYPYPIIDTGGAGGTSHDFVFASAASSAATVLNPGGINNESWANRAFQVYPPDGTGFCVKIVKTAGADSMWQSGNYHIGQSFVYIGGQESRVATMAGGSLSLDDNEYPTLDATTTAHTTYRTAPTVTGIVNGAISNVEALVVDGVSGTIAVGQKVAGTGVSDNTYVSWVNANQQNLSLSRPNTIANDVALTFTADQGFHPRIIGGRIYTRRTNRGSKWRLALDLSFERGSRVSLNHSFDYWANTSSNVSGTAANNINYLNTTSYPLKAPNPETFQTINGYSSQQPSTSMGSTGVGAKSAVVANQRTFLGSVYHKDESGSRVIHTDRILFSPVGKYDVFPSNHYIDVGLGDGDDIVNIIETSDRLLVFKKKKLYVVNIGAGSDAGWFVEGEYAYKGIANKAAAFKTDMGCVWANTNGCYVFDGRQVTDLTEKLDDDTWSTFIGTANNTVVGYVPKKNQIIVVSDATHVGNVLSCTASVNGATSNSPNLTVDGISANGHLEPGMVVTDTSGSELSGTVTIASVTSQTQIVLSTSQSLSNDYGLTFTQNNGSEVYIYDIRTRSWVRNNSLFGQGANKGMTNFIIYNNDLLYGVETTATNSAINKINTASFPQEFEFVTRDEDFGQPSLKKKFYKIYVNYRNNEDADRFLECRYSLNGANAGSSILQSRGGGTKAYTLFGDKAALESDNEWRIATFEVPTPVSGQSISLYFTTVEGGGSVLRQAANIEINEVTIEWRPLRARATAS